MSLGEFCNGLSLPIVRDYFDIFLGALDEGGWGGMGGWRVEWGAGGLSGGLGWDGGLAG